MSLRRLFLLAVPAIILAACSGNRQPVEEQAAAEEQQGPVTLAVADFEQKAPGLVGREVTLSGLVTHTCKHGGKRMFITGENPDISVKIEAGENIVRFDEALEGTEVVVHGIVKELRIDQAYLDEWEKETAQGAGEEMKMHEGEGTGEEGHDEHHSTDLEQIENYRKQLAGSGKDHLTFYSVECMEYKAPAASAAGQ